MVKIYKGTYYDELNINIMTGETLSKAMLYDPITKSSIEFSITSTKENLYNLVLSPDDTRKAQEADYNLELMSKYGDTEKFKMIACFVNFAKVVKSSEGD